MKRGDGSGASCTAADGACDWDKKFCKSSTVMVINDGRGGFFERALWRRPPKGTKTWMMMSWSRGSGSAGHHGLAQSMKCQCKSQSSITDTLASTTATMGHG
ncbi:hypothetical protein FB451DRAFT_1185093 [Mycena latifolia]|nr:hypothetical protein FB451DRAFT_1185093 [Mycena latifolia]